MRFTILIFTICLITGCGTILSIGHVGQQEISINTNIDDPQIKVNGSIVSTQGGKFSVDKSENGAFVRISKEGYKTSQVYLQRNLRPIVVILDTFLIITLIIDYIKNEIYEFSPNNSTVFLTKEER